MIEDGYWWERGDDDGKLLYYQRNAVRIDKVKTKPLLRSKKDIASRDEMKIVAYSAAASNIINEGHN